MPPKNDESTLARHERKNEPKYRSIFTDILKKHSGIINFDGSNDNIKDDDRKHYESEKSLLTNAINSERQAWIGGIAIGILAFATIRYLPTHFIKRFGSEEKKRQLREAEEAVRQNNFNILRNSIGFIIEGLFASWAGVRAYHRLSQGRDDIYEEISRLPLVEGRSVVSDSLCGEWMRAAHGKRGDSSIPKEFWVNLREEKLYDNRTWRAIYQFSQNCILRGVYEKQIRDERGLPMDEPVIIPHPGVPKTLVSDDHEVMSEIADTLVTDSNCST